jgi:hypothetical protein
MGEMCEDCGVFFEKHEFVVTDLSNFKIKHKRIYKRLLSSGRPDGKTAEFSVIVRYSAPCREKPL